ncbi:PAS domain-containing protein [Streptomyces sp. NPDC018031]|uniref:PAS domain-containing protein n=1 Tax=Streptomyces sp. NPDC018031 TaxID=3365033 RepID=UPI0037A7B334
MDETSLSTLLDRMPVSWWEADEGLRVIDCGGGAFRDPLMAQRLLDTLGPRAARPVAHGGIDRLQVHFAGRLFDVSCYPERPSAHGRGRLSGLAVDISTVTSERRRYDAFADFAPAAAFIRDGHGRYLWANHAYAHLYGTTPEEVVGRPVTDFDAPEDAAAFLALDRQILASGKPVRHTLGFHRPDGTPGKAVGHRFPVIEGRQTCVAGIYVDITDYTRALSQRRAAEENLQALSEHSGLPCALLSAGGRIQRISGAAAGLLRARPADLLGRSAHGFLAPADDLAQLWRVWRELVACRRRRIQTSAAFVSADGAHWRARLLLTAVRGDPGRARGVWAMLTHQGLPHRPLPALTAAQIRILAKLAAGHGNNEIAASLGLSRQTLDYHLGRLRDLLGAPTRLALVGRAYVLGILDPQAWPPRSATMPRPSGPR